MTGRIHAKKTNNNNKKRQSDLEVVRRLLDDFGRHPERRPHEGLALDLRVRQLTGHPEVGQLHLAVLRQEHVGGCGRRTRVYVSAGWTPSFAFQDARWTPHL